MLVADFLIQKDRLFAEITLDANELQLYDQIYSKLAINAPTPDLVVYLQAPADRADGARAPARHCSPNSTSRGDYLAALIDAYTRFFHFYDDAPLLIVNASEIDFVNNDASLRPTRFANREHVRHAPVLQPASDVAMSSQSNRSHVTLNTLADASATA